MISEFINQLVGMSNSELEDKVDSLNLLFNVVYMEDLLTSLVLNLSADGVPLVFFARAPDILTLDPKFTLIR